MRRYYNRVEAKQEEKKSQECEIRVRKAGRPQPYIIRAAELLLGEKKMDFVIIQAVEKAIPLALIIAEIIRKRIKDIYQIYTLKTLKVEDVWEPRTNDLGLKTVTQHKDLTIIEIKLAKTVTEEDKKLPGFMDKLPENKEENKTLDEIRQGFGNRGGFRQNQGQQGQRNGQYRGDRQYRPQRNDNNEQEDDKEHNDNGYREERPRRFGGRGRARGFRGRGYFRGGDRDQPQGERRRGGYNDRPRRGNFDRPRNDDRQYRNDRNERNPRNREQPAERRTRGGEKKD